jgi:hypothetical protein
MSRTRKTKDDEVLYGWKQIAICLGCCTRTAQRMEKAEGLPILRPDKRQKWRVLALKRSLIAWMTGGIENVVLTDNRLLAFNRKTHILWSYDFPVPMRSYSPEELEWRLQIVDLDGNGERGVLVTVQFLNSSIPDTLFYFCSEGKLTWQLEADPPLQDRAGRAFDRAWAFKHVVTTPSSDGCVVWAALGNHAGWAGCVLRIDSHGSAAVHFANAGYVERLCPVTLQTDNFIIACGENNDFDDAFVALLGVDDPPACSIPGERLVYRFANAPTGTPRVYILFPKSELIRARKKPYGHAMRIAQHLDGIIVDVETGEEGAYFRYHFSKSLESRYIFPSGSHEFVHQSLEKSGVIAHPWLNCPELQAPLILRTWEPDSGWYDQPIPWRDNPWKELQSEPQ